MAQIGGYTYLGHYHHMNPAQYPEPVAFMLHFEEVAHQLIVHKTPEQIASPLGIEVNGLIKLVYRRVAVQPAGNY